MTKSPLRRHFIGALAGASALAAPSGDDVLRSGQVRLHGLSPDAFVTSRRAAMATAMSLADRTAVARMAMATQRAFDNADSKVAEGKLPDTSTITAREALAWITIEGARMLRMQDKIGSLTPGKQADVVMIRASDLNMQPIHDPVTSVITQTGIGNVDTVLVAGQIKKRHGQLLAPDVGPLHQHLAESGHRIMRDLQALLH